MAECISSVAAIYVRELPAAQYTGARSVAWRDNQRVLIGTRGHGIVEYDTGTGTARTVVAGGELPAGVPDVEKLDTDGTTVVAFNRDRTDVAVDLKRGKIIHSRREAVTRVLDMAVRDGKVAVLGYSFVPRDGGTSPLWFGDVGASWNEHRLLYNAGERYDEYFKFTLAPHGGAVRFLSKDVIAFVIPSEPGIFRYRTDGTPLPRLGKNMTELVTPDMPLVVQKYSTDLASRYDALLNKFHTVDDLVVLDQGPAVIVRRWAKGKVFWELWIPSERSTRKLRLGIEDSRVAGGHLRCDAAAGSKLACLFGKQTRLGQPDRPHLALFDVSKVKQCD